MGTKEVLRRTLDFTKFKLYAEESLVRIFCGFGYETLGKKFYYYSGIFFKTSMPFLHLHSAWLKLASLLIQMACVAGLFQYVLLVVKFIVRVRRYSTSGRHYFLVPTLRAFFLLRVSSEPLSVSFNQFVPSQLPTPPHKLII